MEVLSVTRYSVTGSDKKTDATMYTLLLERVPESVPPVQPPNMYASILSSTDRPRGALIDITTSFEDVV